MPWLPLGACLRWLFDGSSSVVREVFLQLLRTLSWMVDRSSWLAGSSPDPLQGPVLEGPLKRRRLLPCYKEAVLRVCAEGSLKSASLVVQAVARARGWQQRRSDKANAWAFEEQAKYWRQAAWAMRQWKVPIFVFSNDGTRAGGKEMLFGGLWHTGLGQAVWCPPKVGT